MRRWSAPCSGGLAFDGMTGNGHSGWSIPLRVKTLDWLTPTTKTKPRKQAENATTTPQRHPKSPCSDERLVVCCPVAACRACSNKARSFVASSYWMLAAGYRFRKHKASDGCCAVSATGTIPLRCGQTHLRTCSILILTSMQAEGNSFHWKLPTKMIYHIITNE